MKKWEKRKVLFDKQEFQEGSWIAGPCPCTSVLWGQKMKNEKRKKNYHSSKMVAFFPLEPTLLATAAIFLLLYFAGTHNSMTCHESSDWRRVVTGLNFCGYFKLLQIHVKSFDLVRTLRRRSISNRSCLSQEFLRLKIFGVRPNNRNRVKVTSVFHNVWNILKQPGFEATVCEGFVSFACLKVDLDSA